MINLNNDYSEGAHENILKKLLEINMLQNNGYGNDIYCREATDIIKNLCAVPNSDVHFFVGGTQTNLTVIAAALRPYQCAVCASTGHINVHETGAIEATGHKVFPVQTSDGKLTADIIRDVYNKHWSDESHEHIAQPKLVYISNSTEIGTIYNRAELEEIYSACKELNMYLFIDGARLGYALASEKNDLDFKTIAANCDVFYIGGTKCGALFGEAVVINNEHLKQDFRYIIKQRGALLAKGWLIGVQFAELLRDGLYLKLAKNADSLAIKIKNAVLENGFSLYYDSYTNQQFVVFPINIYNELRKKYVFSIEARPSEDSIAVRICTSWATTEENVNSLIADIVRSKREA